MRIPLPVLLLAFSLAIPARAQTPAAVAPPDPWAAWKWLLGEWKTDNPPERGTGTFSFAPDLDGKILVRHHAISFPAAGGKAGSTHSDLLIVYPDPAGNGQRASYWDNEGHYIPYRVEADPGKARVVLTSEAGPGPRFRLTYEGRGDTVDVVFEMAMPGKDFSPYLTGRARRAK